LAKRKIEETESDNGNVGILLMLLDYLKMLYTLSERQRISNLDEDMRLVNFLREHLLVPQLEQKWKPIFPVA
jgi:hypothetical protein